MMKTRIALATALLLSTPVTRAWRVPNSNTDGSSSLPPAASDDNKTPPGLPYVIATEDTLHVSVWKEPELTATVPVRSDGQISLPLVNDVQAAGLTPMQLAAALTEKLKKFVNDPKVTVIVVQSNFPRIYVLGEVLRHGSMVLLPGMTVLQVLATSGLTAFANTKKIYVLRSINGAEQRLPVNYKRLLKGAGMSQNITLRAGDTIVVP